MIIAIPTSIKLFTWISSLLFVDISLTVCYLYIVSSIILFLIGKFTGLVIVNSCIDIILHDTYYVVGHFHFVLSLGAVFNMFIYFHFMLFRLFRVMFIEVVYVCLFIMLTVNAFSLFVPQHILGLYSHQGECFVIQKYIV